MRTSIYIAIPVMIVLAVLQTAVWPYFPILGVIPQIPLLVALCWGLIRGINEGVVWGFIAGIILDAFSISPVGITALAYIIAILIVIWLQQGLPINRFFTPMLVAAFGGIVAMFIYHLILRLSGYPLTIQALAYLPRQAIVHSILVLPIYWLINGIYSQLRPRRVRL